MPVETRVFPDTVSYPDEVSSGSHSNHRRSEKIIDLLLLADVNRSRSRSLYAIGRPSVVCLSSVCNVGAPYSGG